MTKLTIVKILFFPFYLVGAIFACIGWAASLGFDDIGHLSERLRK